MSDDDRITRLANSIMETIDFFTAQEEMTTGEVLNALLAVMIAGAEASPDHQPQRLIDVITATIRARIQ